METALQHMAKAMDSLGKEKAEGKSFEDISLESLDFWRSFQEKLQQMPDPIMREEATTQFKVKLYSAWMKEISRRVADYNPESAAAFSNMQTCLKSLFANSTFINHENDDEIRSNNAKMDFFQKELEDVSEFPRPNRFITVAAKNEKESDLDKLITIAKQRNVGRFKELVNHYIPITKWLAEYKLEYLRGDIIAGLSIGIMVIPQGMAYALLAGLPPQYGLYSAFFPPIVYAIFGSSTFMGISSEAISSLLIGEAIKELEPDTHSPRYIELSNMMGLMAGMLLFIFGIFQFGFVLNFLSRPVLSGFTSAAAVVIALNQLQHFFGISMENSPLLPKLIKDFIENVEDTNWRTVLLALGSLLILILIKRFPRIPKTKIPIPGALIVVILGISFVYGLKLQNYGVKIVGDIPKGLPVPRPPTWNNSEFVPLIKSTVLISLVGFMESISVAKILAARHKLQLRENQEFLGLGLANIFGSFFRTYPTAGALGRTAVCEAVGGRTQISGLVSVCVVTLTLLFLTPVFYYLPKAILASVIIVAVIPLIEYKEAAYLWVSNKRELFLLLMSFILTLIFGVEVGILAAVAADIVLIIYMASRPNTEVMGRLPGTIIYRNIQKFPEAITIPGIVVFRFDASLFFGNVSYLHEKLSHIRRLLVHAKDMCKQTALVFVCDSIAHIDTSSIVGLSEIVQEYAEDGILICFAGLQGGALVAVQTSGLVNVVGKDNFHFRIHDAVNACISGKPLHNHPEELIHEKWMNDRIRETFTLSYFRSYLSFAFRKNRQPTNTDDVHVEIGAPLDTSARLEGMQDTEIPIGDIRDSSFMSEEEKDDLKKSAGAIKRSTEYKTAEVHPPVVELEDDDNMTLS
eukprot:TRINITY_DN7175_c0_g1_i1.p1 TRINITY_DN7175_c0_g1~~TRINITY_DN7175_c0_g1_i1.p1  ORF type:complete len:860 (+),score=253.65 TRINITY_DN7175_c0_g1_i1:122-2701(+)